MIWTQLTHELARLRRTPAAWLAFGVAYLIVTFAFFSAVQAYLDAQPRLATLGAQIGTTAFVTASTFSQVALITLLISPLVTMGLIANERRLGTMTLISTAPRSLVPIIIGKWLTATLWLAMLGGTAAMMVISMRIATPIDYAMIASALLGTTLIASVAAATGLCYSALAGHPTLAALLSLATLLGLWWLSALNEATALTRYLAMKPRLLDFLQGVIDTGDVVYFVALTAFMLFTTVTVLNAEQGR